MIFHTKTKINIGLSVTEKREDGFHNIESIFYPLDYGDVLEVIPMEGFNNIVFETFGFEIPGDASSNLCVKAYHLLANDFKLPAVKSALLKRVPIGAGLGGGSSDGVEMLKALNEMFDLNISSEKLKKYALQLGSDCPFFVENLPKLVTGRGEIMHETFLELKDQWIVLVFPNFHISTPLAYSMITPQDPKFDFHRISDLPINQWKEKIVNDFELPISQKHPEVLEIKNQLKEMGAEYASMSGSGSTVYGVFNKKPRIEVITYPTWTGQL